MGRLILVQIIVFVNLPLFAQNLLLNPDFEQVVQHPKNDLRVYADVFYAKHWFQPTDCSVDIFRDKKICDPDSARSMDGICDFCINVQSGNYCLGFIPLDFRGAMEHITGRLSKPLEPDKQYMVSFYLKFIGHKTPFIPNEVGYKFSNDSIVFINSEVYFEKPAPMYQYLFKKKKIYADFAISEYVIDTTWHRHESIYKAKGGERYLTFGKFAIHNDKRIMKQLNWIMYEPFENKIEKFLKNKHASLVCKNVNDSQLLLKDEDFYCYYFIDNFSVVEIKAP